jgi:hypothetical protein
MRRAGSADAAVSRLRPDLRPWRLLPAVLVLLTGLLAGGIQPPGLLLGTLFAAWMLYPPAALRGGPWLAVSLLGSIALAAHALPGFNPLVLSEPRPFSADAAPYAVRLHWDKLLLAATLLAWWWRQPRPAPAGSRLAWLCVLLTLLLVPALALALGVVAWQPKWPAELAIWLAVNLGVTALAEELLFRGLLQGALVGRFGAVRGVALTALLFGLAHLPFSPAFALVAGLAGLGYGCLLQLSGRLWAAVLLHGAVNLLHLLLLSYPLRLS